MKRFNIDILRVNNIIRIVEQAYLLTKGLPTDNNWKRREWLFDDNYNCIEFIRYRKDGLIDLVKQYYFSPDNLLIKTEHANYPTSLTLNGETHTIESITSFTTRFFYNEHKQRTKEVFYDDQKNELPFTIYYKHNEQGMCLEIIQDWKESYFDNVTQSILERPIIRTLKKFIYDENGVLINEISYCKKREENVKYRTDKFGNIYLEKDKIEYYKKSNLVKKITNYNSKGTPIYMYRYYYDKRHNS